MPFALLQQAQATQPQGALAAFANSGGPLLIGMGLLFYFLMIRPQGKARKEMEARLSKLKAGDEVVLGSGLYATIERVDEKDTKILYIKLGSSVVKAKRQAVVALAADTQQD